MNEKKQTTIKKQQTTANLIKPQVCRSKCNPDTCASISARAPLSTGMCGHVHTLLQTALTLENELVMVNLLYSAATTAVNLSEVFTASKIS